MRQVEAGSRADGSPRSACWICGDGAARWIHADGAACWIRVNGHACWFRADGDGRARWGGVAAIPEASAAPHLTRWQAIAVRCRSATVAG